MPVILVKSITVGSGSGGVDDGDVEEFPDPDLGEFLVAVVVGGASVPTSARPSPTLGVVKVAVPAAGPGRVAEQRADAGEGVLG
jgi:hypothetical protein